MEVLYRSYGFPLTVSVISISQLFAGAKFLVTFLKHALKMIFYLSVLLGFEVYNALMCVIVMYVSSFLFSKVFSYIFKTCNASVSKPIHIIAILKQLQLYVILEAHPYHPNLKAAAALHRSRSPSI